MFRPCLGLTGATFASFVALGCISPPTKAPKKAEVSDTTLWTLSSPDFAGGSAMPEEFTCNGRGFGSGANPELDWNEGPDGTQSYALVLKDITLTAQMADATTVSSAYYWALWNIPATVRQVPHDLSAAASPPEVEGAEQWAMNGQTGYLSPCPNADPSVDAGERVTDHFAFTLYALPKSMATPNFTLGSANEAQTLDDYLKTVALHDVDLLFTSNAASESSAGGEGGAGAGGAGGASGAQPVDGL